MKISKNIKATSIVEAMVVMVVIISGVVGMYDLLNKSNKLITSEKNKIQAIQIARQGIEAFTNIRDSNWIIFSGDYKNCWNVFNYNPLCIGNITKDYDIQKDSNYKIYVNNDSRWELEDGTSISPNLFTNPNYKNFYRVGLKNGIYSQSGITESLEPFFTREIKVNYLDDDGDVGDETNQKMEINSIVQWADNTSSLPHKIEIKQILSNWKGQK